MKVKIAPDLIANPASLWPLERPGYTIYQTKGAMGGSYEPRKLKDREFCRRLPERPVRVQREA